jgi:hypothetical protein
MTNDEWEQRLVQAATLQDEGLDCSLCAGTGGWPGLGGGSGMGTWVPCKACDETGRKQLAAASPDGLAP